MITPSEGTLRTEELVFVPVRLIDPDPDQPRRHFDGESLRELGESILQQGLLEPLIIYHAGELHREDRYRLVAGERRWRAAHMVGVAELPCRIREYPNDEIRILEQVAENFGRADLTAVEEARAYLLLQEKCGLTQAEIGARFGKDQRTVSNTLKVLELPEAVQELVGDGRLRKAHAQQVHRFRESAPTYCVWLAQQAAERGLSEKALREPVPLNWEAARSVLVPLNWSTPFDFKKRCPGCPHYLGDGRPGEAFCGNPALYAEHAREAEQARIEAMAGVAGQSELTGQLLGAAGVAPGSLTPLERDRATQAQGQAAAHDQVVEARQAVEEESRRERLQREARAQLLFDQAREAALERGEIGSRDLAALVYQQLVGFQDEDLKLAAELVGLDFAAVWPQIPEDEDEDTEEQLSFTALAQVPPVDLVRFALLAELEAERRSAGSWSTQNFTRWYLGLAPGAEIALPEPLVLARPPELPIATARLEISREDDDQEDDLDDQDEDERFVCARCDLDVPEDTCAGEEVETLPNGVRLDPRGHFRTPAALYYCRECRPDVRICEACGCTDEAGCEQGCAWTSADVDRCSACDDPDPLYLEPGMRIGFDFAALVDPAGTILDVLQDPPRFEVVADWDINQRLEINQDNPNLKRLPVKAPIDPNADSEYSAPSTAGTSEAPQPNEHGVYPENAGEVVLRLTNRKTSLLVRLLETPEGWLYACSLEGPGHGTSSPLSSLAVRLTRFQALRRGYDLAKKSLIDLRDRGQSKALSETARRLLDQVNDAVWALNEYEEDERRRAAEAEPAPSSSEGADGEPRVTEADLAPGLWVRHPEFATVFELQDELVAGATWTGKVVFCGFQRKHRLGAVAELTVQALRTFLRLDPVCRVHGEAARA